MYKRVAFKSDYWRIKDSHSHMSFNALYVFNLFPELDVFDEDKDRMSWKSWYPMDEEDKIRSSYWSVLC
jgi:hypothetical protein